MIIGDYLRLILRVAMFLNLLALSLLSVYGIMKFALFCAAWLDRTIFLSPW